jgi:uncharacterized delta-60 repeat protein
MKLRAIVLAAIGMTSGTAVLGEGGELDPTFGVNGLVRIAVELDRHNAAAVFAQPDGKLLVGWANDAANDISLLRLDSDGARDSFFGSNGLATLDIPRFFGPGLAVIQQADGNVVTGGFTIAHSSDFMTSEDLGLARFLADGRVDTGFGSSGIAKSDFETNVYWATAHTHAIVQQSDGKVVAAGVVFYAGGWAYGFGGEGHMALTRFDSAGGVDPTFGMNGRRVLVAPDDAFSDIRWLVQQADGKLVAAGYIGEDMTVVRLTPDGARDPSFDGDGIAIVALARPPGATAVAEAVAVQADGKIVVSGTLRFSCDRDDPACAEFVDGVIARLNPDGSLDTGFGVDGTVTFDVDGGRTQIARGGLVIEPTGTMVIGGDMGSVEGPRYGFLARFTPNGVLDTTFGNAGVTLIDVGRDATFSNAEMRGMARFADGKIAAVLAVHALDEPGPSIVVARVAPSGRNPGVIGLARTELNANERGDATLVVRRTGGAAGEIGIDYATRFTSVGGAPAASAADFTMTVGTLLWLDGDTTERMITVPIAPDDLIEAPESFVLELSNPRGAGLAARRAHVAITDVNDGAGVLEFEAATRSVQEGVAWAEIRVTRTGGSTGAVSVVFSSFGLTAIEDSDFLPQNGELQWANGDSGSKGILLRPWMDYESEADESFRVTLSAPTGGATLGHASAIDVTILDVATAPPPGGDGSGGGGSGGAGEGAGGGTVFRDSGGGGASGVLECLLLLSLLVWFRRRQRPSCLISCGCSTSQPPLPPAAPVAHAGRRMPPGAAVDRADPECAK